MNDKRFRKYWSFSIFLSLLGMFELEAKEEEKEEKKTERKKEKNAQHTLGKVTTQAAKIFNYNNQTTISSKELESKPTRSATCLEETLISMWAEAR
ncbi:hypothetical protein C2S45_03435 [Helicobacter pylori]|nr:hypothetical protein C2S45_03435 [Helicobacter pylori]